LKYTSLIVVFPQGKNLPEEIIEGIRMFTLENKMNLKVVEAAQPKHLTPGTLFITPTDDALIELIELQQKTKFKLGKDIGIISYNENPLKRILAGGITTISSDFAKMGTTVAELILKKQSRFIHNSFNIIKRKSL
jgi:DNA-binding LacI/PurR family transcriptional regulator